jgi:histidyl-tRNA synthetase
LYRAVEATRDILPGEVERWQFVEEAAREIFARYGFSELRTPIFEFTELFKRSVGESSDIVSKEMYTFTDRGERSLTLRPEGTAPTVRAYVQHQTHKTEDITRWYYAGPMFRYERKQKGRYRQFAQIGAEVLGAEQPHVDAEVIEMVMFFLARLGLEDLVLRLNSIGCSTCRADFGTKLKKALTPVLDDYCGDCKRRYDTNILRILDCKIDHERVKGLPSILDELCDDCRQHFTAVRGALEDAGVSYELTPHLVRGLDYYMRTAFEVTASGLGAQNALLGGGRYDGLVKQLGGPDVPGFGFALGLDRLVMILPEDAGLARKEDLSLVALGDEGMRAARRLAVQLRHGGLKVGLPPDARSMKSQMRRAGRVGARYVAILGDDELAAGHLVLKRLADGHQNNHPLDDAEGLIEVVLND